MSKMDSAECTMKCEKSAVNAIERGKRSFFTEKFEKWNYFISMFFCFMSKCWVSFCSPGIFVFVFSFRRQSRGRALDGLRLPGHHAVNHVATVDSAGRRIGESDVVGVVAKHHQFRVATQRVKSQFRRKHQGEPSVTGCVAESLILVPAARCALVEPQQRQREPPRQWRSGKTSLERTRVRRWQMLIGWGQQAHSAQRQAHHPESPHARWCMWALFFFLHGSGCWFRVSWRIGAIIQDWL